MATQEVALRKRQQIAKANRMMFIWIASVSVLVGFAAVTSVFLLNKAKFNETVLSAKATTADTLTKNAKSVLELKDQIRVLNTNQALRDSMVPGEEQPLQVVLDALPSTANSSAFGSSLQERFLNADGLKIESLAVDPVSGVESQSVDAVQDASTTSASSSNIISFSFVVSADANQPVVLQDLLKRLERSIRAINVTSLILERQGDRLNLTVSGEAYYEPAKSAALKEVVISPNTKQADKAVKK